MPTANSLRANLRWSWVKFPMFRCSETRRRESYLDVRGRLGLVGASNFFGYQLWFWVTLRLKAFWFGVELIIVFEAEMIQFFRIHSSLSRSAGHERDR